MTLASGLPPSRSKRTNNNTKPVGSWRVAADADYQNAMNNSGEWIACIEHDEDLLRVMTAFLKGNTELFKRFSDNDPI